MQRPLLPVFLSATLVVTAYIALIQAIPFRIQKGQNQADTNMLRAQEYLAHPYNSVVLVGSSLTFRLPVSGLGPHIANLAMAGGAPATGLALVDRANTRPKLVLVEINLLGRGPDLDQVHALLRSPERQLREHFRALRTGYDPVNLTERAIQALWHKSDEDLIPPPDTVRQLIASQQRSMAAAPDSDTLRHNLSETAALVSALEKRGIRVGFFEMPVDASLTDLSAEKGLRRAVEQQFPASQFCWLKLSVPGGAHTLDGIHLMSDDAALVARQVMYQSMNCPNLKND